MIDIECAVCHAMVLIESIVRVEREKKMVCNHQPRIFGAVKMGHSPELLTERMTH